MKSPHPQDPVRLEVTGARATVAEGFEEIYVTVEFRYDPWEPSRAMDVIYEQANALLAIRNLLDRGGLNRD